MEVTVGFMIRLSTAPMMKDSGESSYASLPVLQEAVFARLSRCLAIRRRQMIRLIRSPNLRYDVEYDTSPRQSATRTKYEFRIRNADRHRLTRARCWNALQFPWRDGNSPRISNGLETPEPVDAISTFSRLCPTFADCRRAMRFPLLQALCAVEQREFMFTVSAQRRR